MASSVAGSDKANPFAEKVSGGEYFVGREAELAVFQENLDALKAGQPNHCYIAGLDGTGKSSYLYKLVEIAKAGKCVGVYLPLDSSIPAHGQLATILREIVENFQKQASPRSAPPSHELMDDWDRGSQSKLFRHPRSDQLVTADLHRDFECLEKHITAVGFCGTVVCIDEGQRIEPLALSAIKNALGTLGSFLFVLSLRLVSDARGAVEEGRQLLNERARAAEGDIGASGFYVTGTAIGPFNTDDEVRRLFAVRLKNKPIQFSDDVQLRIGEIGDRVPRKMINFAAQLYNRAMAAQVTFVDILLLNDCFQERCPDEMKQAVDLCANLSDDVTHLLKALCAFSKPAAAIELVNHMFAGYDQKAQVLIADGVGRQLDKLCISSGILQKTEDRYKITSNVYRYALKITLRLT